MIKIEGDFTEENLAEEVLHRLIKSRLTSKKNVVISIVGPMGSGKSYTALKIATLVQQSPKFNVREQVIYDPTKFLEAVKNAKEKGYKVLILDEAHVVAPAQLWHSFSNLAISLVSSVFRQVHQMVLIMVAPSLKWVEKRLRELTDYYVVVNRADSPHSKAAMCIYKVKMNYFFFGEQEPYISKVWFIYNNTVKSIRVIRLNLPDPDVVEEYEKIAKEFKSSFITKKMEEISVKMEKKMGILDQKEVSI